MIRCSSLPMVAACACFKGDENRGEEDKNAGTARHTAMADALAGKPIDGIPDDEIERVEWAVEYIKCHAPNTDHQLHVERKLSVMDDNFEIITAGTPDVCCGPELFDLKWRERDYKAQMAAYAWAMMQESGWSQVRIHVLFAERKFAQVFTLTIEDASAIVLGIIKRSQDAPNPTACDYCGWCANRLTCTEMTRNVKPLVEAREEFNDAQRAAFSEWLAGGAHASKLSDAAFMGVALKIARQISEWCDAIEHHAKEMAIKQGVVPTGFKLQSRQGNRYIPSVADAYARAGLPQDEFLKACEIKFSSLVETFADLNGMKKAQAERTVEEKLGNAVQRKSPSQSLVAEKGAK